MLLEIEITVKAAGMILKATQLLSLAVLIHQMISTSTEEVHTRWTYNSNNRNTTLLPDSIQIDFDYESGKIMLNLIKKSINSPLIITQFEGKRFAWNSIEDEILGVYKDSFFGAYATVTIKEVDMVKETLYAITFTHANKSFSVEPGDTLLDKPSLIEIGNQNNYRKRLLVIDGKLHSLTEIQTTQQDPQLNNDLLRNKINETRLRKRSTHGTANQYTFEIFTVIDYSTFMKYYTKSTAPTDSGKREDARKTIKYFFTHIMEGVKGNYETLSSDRTRYTTKWVGALIAESPGEVPFIEDEKVMINSHTINGTSALFNLVKWIKKDIKLPNYDFLAAYTSYRMIDEDNKDIGGIAHFADICTSSSSGLIEYRGTLDTIFVTSHELGHALGMPHDGEDFLFFPCPDNNYIMAPESIAYSKDNFHNAFAFSLCSRLAIVVRISIMDDVDCLLDGRDSFSTDWDEDIFMGLYPGQLYDLDDQCKMLMGPQSFYCGGQDNDKEMCQIIRCYNGDQCQTHSMLNAMDGTACSKGAWCRKGVCTPDSRAPRTPDRCTTGDRKHPFVSNSTKTSCQDELTEDPKKCEDKHFKKECCASCVGNRTKNEGCQDSIDECRSLEPSDCYNNYYATTCCKTCSALVSNPSDAMCLYGDKGSGCKDMVPAVCHLSTRYCCHTCAAYLFPTN